MKVKDLKSASYNPRKITKEQLTRLKKSLEEFGDLSGIVFNIRTQTLIGGHQRAKNMDASWEIIKEPHTDKVGTVAIGYIETDSGRMTYREVDWPEAKEKAANIAANKHGGEFDDELLRGLIEELKINDIDMELIGFDDAELNIILTSEIQETAGPMSKNFNQGYGGQFDGADPTEMGVDGRYPVTFILDQEEFESWVAVKDKIKIRSDKTAFLKIIGGYDA